MKKMDWLQALRGVAALMVVFFHLTPHWEGAEALKPFASVMRYGFSGVDVFFALSGFVVARFSMEVIGVRQVVMFMSRRVKRIFLGYWPVVVLTALVAHVLMGQPWPSDEKMFGSIFLLYPSLFDNWLPTAWSLTYELMFYTLIAGVLLCPMRCRLRMLSGLLCAYVCWNLCVYIFYNNYVISGQQPFRFAMSAFAIEFLIGAVIAYLYESKVHPFNNAMVVACIAFVLFFLCATVGAALPAASNIEILRVGTFGFSGIFLLVSCLALHESNISPPRWIVGIGDASFTLYLIHPILLDLCVHLRMGLKSLHTSKDVAILIALPLIVIFISTGWYKFIEQKLYRSKIFDGRE
jgi:exopolysaccharide production protein ExoZ